MHEQKRFASDWEYKELHRMLSEAMSRGYEEQVPVMKPNRFSPNQEWYQEKETGEIYSLDAPDEKNRGWWDRVEMQDLVDPDQRLQ